MTNQEKQDRVVFLCPGWGSFDLIAWTFLAKEFSRKGYDVIFCNYPGRGLGPIEETARTIDSLITTIMENDQYTSATFIGHSMGGLVGKYIVKVLKNPYIDHYVSLGTPHKGSHFAPLASWFSHSAKQMRTDAQFLSDLERLEWPSNVEALCIQGKLDMVVPSKFSKMGDAENLEIKTAFHVSFLFLRRTFYEIWAWLTYDLFGEPGPYSTSRGVVYKATFPDGLSIERMSHRGIQEIERLLEQSSTNDDSE